MASSGQPSSGPRSQSSIGSDGDTAESSALKRSDSGSGSTRSAAAKTRSRASTSKSTSNSRAKTRSARRGSGTATKNSRPARSTSAARTSSHADNGLVNKVTGTVSAAKKAKAPLVAGGAAAAGLAAGTILSSKLRAHQRPHVLGLPMPRGSEVKSGVRQAARAGQWMAGLQADIRAVRAQAEQSRRQSPIEVLLSALTSRRLPRHDLTKG
jgi:hypothetical protein